MLYKKLKKQLNEQFAVNAALLRENVALKQELASKQEELEKKQITLDAEMKFSDQAQDKVAQLMSQVEHKEKKIKELYDILNGRRKPARKNETKQEQPKKQPKEDVDPYPEE